VGIKSGGVGTNESPGKKGETLEVIGGRMVHGESSCGRVVPIVTIKHHPSPHVKLEYPDEKKALVKVSLPKALLWLPPIRIELMTHGFSVRCSTD
jgi:hypothetical protein